MIHTVHHWEQVWHATTAKDKPDQPDTRRLLRNSRHNTPSPPHAPHHHPCTNGNMTRKTNYPPQSVNAAGKMLDQQSHTSQICTWKIHTIHHWEQIWHAMTAKDKPDNPDTWWLQKNTTYNTLALQQAPHHHPCKNGNRTRNTNYPPQGVNAAGKIFDQQSHTSEICKWMIHTIHHWQQVRHAMTTTSTTPPSIHKRKHD